VRDTHDDYAHEVARVLRASGVRVAVDEASEPLGARIRRAKLEKIPYILAVGDSDVAARTIGVNKRGDNDPRRDVPLDDFVRDVTREIADHGSPEDH